MLVIETILIYLIVFQFLCLAEMLSVHGHASDVGL